MQHRLRHSGNLAGTLGSRGGTSWQTYWNARNFHPGADASLIVSVLNEALTNYRNVKITEPGVYEINNTIWIPSNTTLYFVAGVTFRKKTGSNFSHMFGNKGMLTGTRNNNIKFYGNGIRLEVNGIDNWTLSDPLISPVPRCRAQFQFFRVDDFIVDDFYVDDGGNDQFILCCIDCHGKSVAERATISNIDIEGDKDGLDLISCSDINVINYASATNDDAIFLGVGYTAVTPFIGDTERITFTNLTFKTFTPTGGYGARIYDASWAIWANGQTYKTNEYCVNAGKIYANATVANTVASVAPTHTTGHVLGADGLDWWYVQDGVITEANIRDITFENVTVNSDRAIWRFYHNYVTPGTEGNSIIDNITIDTVSVIAGYNKFLIQHLSNIGTLTVKNTNFTTVSPGGFLSSGISTGTSSMSELVLENCILNMGNNVIWSFVYNASYTFGNITATNCQFIAPTLMLFTPNTWVLNNATLSFTGCQFTVLRLMSTTNADVNTIALVLNNCSFLTSIAYVAACTQLNKNISYTSTGTAYINPSGQLFYNDKAPSTFTINLSTSSGTVTPTKVRNGVLVTVIACDLPYV